MTVDKHDLVAIIPSLNITLGVKRATVTLAEDRAPYAQATLICSNPTAEEREAIDLRDGDLFVDLRLRRDFGAPWSLADLTEAGGNSIAGLTSIIDGAPLSALTNSFYRPWNGAQVRAAQSRLMRLWITDRAFNDLTGEATITAESGEALLIGDLLADSSPVDPSSTDLATIVQSVLDRYDAQLQADPSTATVAEADATIWRPGIYAWDYLEPLLEAASLKLWCDDAGRWYLTERQPVVEGQVVAAATQNVVDFADRMTYDADVWTDAVVVEYRWTDDFDLNQVAYDAAGEQPSRAGLHLVRENTVYPGAGAAAGILNRSQGRGRVLEVGVVSNYEHTPGQAAQITPLVGDVQTGYLAAVTWKYPDGEAELRTRGLTDTPETAYIFGPSGFSYLDVPVDTSYLDFDWSIAS